MLSSQKELEDAALRAPAIFVLDARSSEESRDPRQLRSQLGQSHVIVAIVEALSESIVSTLYSADVDDVVDTAGAHLPVSVLARAASRLCLREQAERERRRAHGLQAALDSLPVPVFYKDMQGIYLGCNTAFEGFIGIERDRIVGHTVYDVAPSNLAVVYERADRDLIGRGGTQSYEAHVRYADGSEHDVLFHKAVFNDAAGKPNGLAGAMLDITERKKLEAELRWRAEQDPLTGLANRRKFFALTANAHEKVNADALPHWALVIDIDHFKEINDRFGHATGDRALIHVGHAIQDALRADDIVARAGGEEFFAVVRAVDCDTCLAIAERVRSAVARSAPIEADTLPPVTVSVGVARWNAEKEHIDNALRRADAQMYRAKRRGRNCIAITPEERRGAPH